MDDFQEKSNRFLEWFKSAGGEFRDDLIEIRDLRAREAGRGIVAINNIPQGTILFTIPRSAIINVETSELAQRLPGIFDVPADDDDDGEPLDSWTSLILVMIYEYLQGESSNWKPYFDILPSTFDTPIFWSEEELSALAGTCLTVEKVGRNESDQMLKTRVLPLVRKHDAVFFPPNTARINDEALLALAHRMGSTVMAYAFDLENDDDEDAEEEEGWVEDRDGKTMLGMVPMADVLNANAEFNAHVNHGEKLEVTVLRSSTPAGTEILNYYGPLPSSELLRRYGYLTPEHQRYDIAEIAWKDVKESLARHLNVSADIISQADKSFEEGQLEEYFVIERDAGEPDEEGRSMHTPKLSDISEELAEQFKYYLKAMTAQGLESLDKRKRSQIYNMILSEVLEIKISSYPTTRAEDEELLARSSLSKRLRMAVSVRLGEKRLVEEALNLIRNKTDASEDLDMADAEPERPSKRTRTG